MHSLASCSPEKEGSHLYPLHSMAALTRGTPGILPSHTVLTGSLCSLAQFPPFSCYLHPPLLPLSDRNSKGGLSGLLGNLGPSSDMCSGFHNSVELCSEKRSSSVTWIKITNI